MEPRDVAPGSDVESQWFDVRTAAKYLCMTRHAIYHRINRCQLPFIRDGRRVRFDRDALDRWMKKGEKYGFAEARRHLVLPEDDQRSPVPRIYRVRRQEGRRAAGQRDRTRHPRRRPRLEEHDPELR